MNTVVSTPTVVPPTLNVTDATPTSSLALAETVMLPETFALPGGAVMNTEGGLSAVTLTIEDCALLPALS